MSCVIVLTEVGTVNSPARVKPWSAMSASMRLPTAHIRVVPGARGPSVRATKSASTSLKRPTSPWSEPKTIAPMAAGPFRFPRGGAGGSPDCRMHSARPSSTVR